MKDNFFGNVDDELKRVLQFFPNGGMNLENIDEAREIMINSYKSFSPSKNIHIENKEIDSIFEKNKIKLRIYSPKNEYKEKFPILLWMHGGGYLVGNLDTSDMWASFLCENANIIVVSIDYRLAPENIYPAPIYDSYSALKWISLNTNLKFDKNNIIVGGDSAGGGLATCLSLYNRDYGDVSIKYQLLLYPMLDDKNTKKEENDKEYYIWNKDNNLKAWTYYLGYNPENREVPIYASPLRCKNLSNMPKTFIGIGGIDLFLQENIEYAKNLLISGVSTEFHIYPDAYHAFPDFEPLAKISKNLKRDILNALKKILD